MRTIWTRSWLPPMDDRLHALLVCFGVMSLLAFVLFGTDKFKAKTGRRRIPERTLLAAALLGGGAGALLGMYTFHHKTRKQPFPVLVPLFFLLQAALVVLLWLRTAP